MKKRLSYLLILMTLFTLILVGCGNNNTVGQSTENTQNTQNSENEQESESEVVCEHEFANATCTEAPTCTKCGEVNGEALGHSYADATCTAPATCNTCGATEGSAKEHDFKAATCTKPETCKVCGATKGNANGHSYSEATCTKPATCSVCGATNGKAKGHAYVNGTCANCGAAAPSIEITASMDTALFIGDSRTEGIRLYTKEYTGTSDFFSATSSSVSSIISNSTKVDIAGVGNVNISELLDQKRYDKIYIMLGINEAGNGPDVIAQNTKKLIELIQKKQPDTVIFILANFYVSAGYSSTRPVFKTSNMKAINAAQGALANNKDIFYLDANPMFVDANGDLSTKYSNDGCHLNKQSCKDFASWLIEQTKVLLGL